MFDETTLIRLAVIKFARNAGFTLAEIEATAARLAVMRELLRAVVRCGCIDLDECGRLISRRMRG